MNEYRNGFDNKGLINNMDNGLNHYYRRKRRGRKKNLLKNTITLSLCAALFGGISGGSFYYVNRTLTESDALAYAENISQETGTVFQTMQYTNSNAEAVQTSYSTGHYSLSLDVTDIAAQGLSSVVSVTNISVQEVENFFGRFGRNSNMPKLTQETISCGSGVIIKNDGENLYMATNYHVVEGAITLSVTFADDETYQAQLCGYDEENDIAVIKVSLSDVTEDTLSQISVVSIGDSDELIVGEQVVAIGNALGYGQSVTTGIVSAVDRKISTDSSSATYIQTDAAINPGNSGGALLNMNGELIGINTAKIASSDVEGMGYAIPISRAMDIIESIMGEDF